MGDTSSVGRVVCVGGLGGLVRFVIVVEEVGEEDEVVEEEWEEEGTVEMGWFECKSDGWILVLRIFI